MALSEAQRKANDKYIKEHYKQVKLSMPKGEADLLEEYCKFFNYSKAGFIRQAIREKMLRDIDLGEIPSQSIQEHDKLISLLGVELMAGGGSDNTGGPIQE